MRYRTFPIATFLDLHKSLRKQKPVKTTVEDASSLLEVIRAEQLSTILGKYKLF